MIFETETPNGRRFGNYNEVKVIVDGVEQPNVTRVKVNNDEVWISESMFKATFKTQSTGNVTFYSTHGFNVVNTDTNISASLGSGNSSFSAQAGVEYEIKSSYYITQFRFTSGTFEEINIENSWTLASAKDMFTNLVSLTKCYWNGENNCTNFENTWKGCTNLVDFSVSSTSNITNFTSTWSGCSSLTSFPMIDVSAANQLINTWAYCSNFTSFPSINTSSITQFFGTWIGCSNLTSFPLINTSNATQLDLVWSGCSNLTSFPQIVSDNTTSMQATWNGCSNLISFPFINTSNVSNFTSTWRHCDSLASFPLLNFQSAQILNTTWEYCNSLSSFPLINTSNVTDFKSAWANTNLSTLSALDFSSGLDFTLTFSNSLFTHLPDLNTSSGTIFTQMFYNSADLLCLKSIDTTNQTNTSDMFFGCSSLANPNASNRALIESGANWTNSYSCPGVAPGTITDFNATDNVSNKVILDWSTASGSPPPQYDVYNGISLLNSNIFPGFELSAGVYTDLYLKATNIAGSTESNHVQGSSLLEIDLQPEVTDFSLKDKIDNYSIGETVVKITNNNLQPTIISGDLTGLDVTLENNATIEGTDPSSTALSLSSTLLLINNGIIRGAGGRGGDGGKGGDGFDTTVPATTGGIGGDGGLGGDPDSFNTTQSNGTPGLIGTDSTPSGGNSGGQGGDGGDGATWGNNGNSGLDGQPGTPQGDPGLLGQPGSVAGYGISGGSYLASGSINGTVIGGIV